MLADIVDLHMILLLRKHCLQIRITIVLYKRTKNIPCKTACTNGLPDDNQVMFETCRRHEESN